MTTMGQRCRNTLVTTLISLFLASGVIASVPALEQADLLYSMRYDIRNVQEAIEILSSEEARNAGAYEADWRLSRIYWFLADKALGKERLKLFEKAKSYAEKAVAERPNGFEGYYWLASSTGSLAMEKGALYVIIESAKLRAEIEKCISIAPANAEARNLHAIFLWKLPALFGGSLAEAEEEARLAVRLEPDNPVYWGVLGNILEVRGDYTGSREAFRKVLSLPDRKDDPIENERFKSEAMSALKRMEGKK